MSQLVDSYTLLNSIMCWKLINIDIDCSNLHASSIIYLSLCRNSDALFCAYIESSSAHAMALQHGYQEQYLIQVHFYNYNNKCVIQLYQLHIVIWLCSARQVCWLFWMSVLYIYVLLIQLYFIHGSSYAPKGLYIVHVMIEVIFAVNNAN